MFAVKKKNDEQRLVLDCRYSSCHFKDPPKVHLASGQSFASIEVEPGQQVWLGNVDIKVAFYAMQLPAELMKYFGLPYDVRAGDVGVTHIRSVDTSTPIHPDTRITPVFAAIPMGWTHSLAVCQSILEGLSRKAAGITADNALVDRKLAPDIKPLIHTEYADNFESYAYQEPLVAKAATEVEGLLNDAGLPTHEVLVTKGGASLGWEFSAVEPILGVSNRGMWRLRLGLLEFARRGYGSGHQLEILVGHFTSRALLRRELLSVVGRRLYVHREASTPQPETVAVGDPRIDVGCPPHPFVASVTRCRLVVAGVLLRRVMVGVWNRHKARPQRSRTRHGKTLRTMEIHTGTRRSLEVAPHRRRPSNP